MGAAPGQVRNSSPGGAGEYAQGAAPDINTIIPANPARTHRALSGAPPRQVHGVDPPPDAAAALTAPPQVLPSKLILRIRTTIDTTVSSSTTNLSNSSVTII